MKVRLLRRARIWHNAGETVEVSSAEAGFLLSTGSAQALEPGRETRKKTATNAGKKEKA